MNPRRLLLALLLAAGPAFAAPTIEEVHALDAKCEAARTAKLEPIRAQKTAQCAAQGRRGEDECRTFYSTYGDNSSRGAWRRGSRPLLRSARVPHGAASPPPHARTERLAVRRDAHGNPAPPVDAYT